MATPNIVPQQTNDGRLGRHGLRWAGIAAHVLSSPVVKLVKNVDAANEEALELSVDANGSLVLTNDGVAVATATATDVADLEIVVNTLAGVDISERIDGSVLVYEISTNKWTATLDLEEQNINGGSY